MTKACWLVILPGRPPFAMVGDVVGREEALAAARAIWPEAEVE